MQRVQVPQRKRLQTFKGQPLVFPSQGYVTVPCGKCAYCLVNRRTDWMFRVFHEMRRQEYPGYFLTFTYDERHVKRVDDGRLSLRFRDIQLYLKRLRKAEYYAKYICVGEYGSDTHRPHYHMLIWSDAPAERLESEWKSSKDGTSMGFVYFGSITLASAMYCLKYIIQPKQRPVDGLEKTRAQFSKGLGISYLTNEVYEWHTSDYESPIFTSVIHGKTVALPRYYRKKIFTRLQCTREASRVKWLAIEKKRKHMRELLRRGIKGTNVYMQKLRVEGAKRIISKTKYTTYL